MAVPLAFAIAAAIAAASGQGWPRLVDLGRDSGLPEVASSASGRWPCSSALR